jgi:hypothetical protein
MWGDNWFKEKLPQVHTSLAYRQGNNLQYRVMNVRFLFKKTYRYLLDVLPDAWAIRLSYFRHLKRRANLKKPQALSEKINWRKLYQRDPRFIVFADKVAVKSEIANLVGEEYVIPTLWAGETPEEIPFDQLEPPYVIKVNHASGQPIFIRKKDDIAQRKIYNSLHEQLSHAYGKRDREWAYLAIPRKILIEPMLETAEKAVPEDYKFFVYRGRALFVQIDFDRFGNMCSLFCDRNWNKIPMTWGYPDVERAIPKPEHFEKMLEISEKIGAQFDFARIDLYQVPSGIFFGETTFYPDAGYGKIEPVEWDFKFGEPWVINA